MAQNLKTEGEPPIDIEALPELTDKQNRYVTARLEGKSGADSVRAATDTSTWAKSSIWAEASKLEHHPSIRLWLNAARRAALGAQSVTLEQHLRELERLKEIAISTGNIGAAVKAEESRGRAGGLYVEQTRDITDHDPARTLKEIAQTNPELASSLAKQHNIPWQDKDTQEAQTRH